MAHRALILVAMCLMGAVGVAAGKGPPTPEGGAVASFREYCRLCHGVPSDLGRQRPYAEWRDTVARMSERRQRLRRGEIPVSSQILIARYLAGEQ